MINEIFEKYFFINDPVDRFTDPQNTLFKIPKITNLNITLEECIEERINIIKNKKYLYLLWSGGIDSTLVLYALLKNNINFSVIMTTNSQLEYPMLFDLIINNKLNNIKYYLVNSLEEILIEKEAIILTGEIGDQLIGSSEYKKYLIKHLSDDYKLHLNNDFLSVTENTVLKFINNINFDLKMDNNAISLAEYLWAVNFIYKYDNVIKRISYDFKKRYNIEYNFFHFFNSDNFQIWSMINYKNNTKFDSIKKYKQIYKEYIFKINQDENYFKNKTKIGSLYASGLT